MQSREEMLKFAAAFGAKALIRDNPPTSIDALCDAAQIVFGLDDDERARLLICLCDFDSNWQATKRQNTLAAHFPGLMQ